MTNANHTPASLPTPRRIAWTTSHPLHAHVGDFFGVVEAAVDEAGAVTKTKRYFAVVGDAAGRPQFSPCDGAGTIELDSRAFWSADKEENLVALLRYKDAREMLTMGSVAWRESAYLGTILPSETGGDADDANESAH